MKKMCKEASDIGKKYVKQIADPEYYCKKCGRPAKDESLLCKSKKIKLK